MKLISIHMADGMPEISNPEPVTIVIDEILPEYPGYEKAHQLYSDDAEKIADALQKVLPGGTLARLTALLMTREAGKNFLRIIAHQ